MKAQVESRISYTELEKLEVLISILNRINACENESELRDAFSGKKVDWYKTYFIWGSVPTTCGYMRKSMVRYPRRD